jgi:hypothetical protein
MLGFGLVFTAFLAAFRHTFPFGSPHFSRAASHLLLSNPLLVFLGIDHWLHAYQVRTPSFYLNQG